MRNLYRGTLETILVVEDDDCLLQMIVSVLENANFRVLWADSGADALQLLEDTGEQIDLLLSDVIMPEMSGLDLSRALQSSRTDMQVMLMSGETNYRAPVVSNGWSFISKPFVPLTLVTTIKDLLQSESR